MPGLPLLLLVHVVVSQSQNDLEENNEYCRSQWYETLITVNTDLLLYLQECMNARINDNISLENVYFDPTNAGKKAKKAFIIKLEIVTTGFCIFNTGYRS